MPEPTKITAKRFAELLDEHGLDFRIDLESGLWHEHINNGERLVASMVGSQVTARLMSAIIESKGGLS